MGSPCLKESLETYLSDVLNDSTEASAAKDRSASEKIVAEVSSDVEDRGPNRDTDTSILDLPVVTTEKGAPSMTGLPHTNVPVPPEDSQDSILDIEGFGDDGDEVSLMDWSAQQDGEVPPSSQAACDSAPKQPGCFCEGDTLKDRHKNQDTWRSQVHPDDPFLSLIPCEIPRLASVLQQCQQNHLEAYKRSGLPISGAIRIKLCLHVSNTSIIGFFLHVCR